MAVIHQQVIATIKTDFKEKFGIPRQSGLVGDIHGYVVFEPDYRNKEALRGLEAYSHLWLIWQFSKAVRDHWSPTVRPPRLGGNKRLGVFATRSPFRPNAIGLSCVQLVEVTQDQSLGPVIHVLGADLLDGTPILDIKPYLAYTDAHPEATTGAFDTVIDRTLKVVCEEGLLKRVPQKQQAGLIAVLEQDPRPAYQNDPERVYGMHFSDYQIHFRVIESVLYVVDIQIA